MMDYRWECTGYAWAWGLGAKGKLNAHLLWRGNRTPVLQVIKNYWHKRTGNFIVDIRPAGTHHVPYLGKNASQLPNPRANKSGFSDWERIMLGPFRRVGYSKKYSFKAPPKTAPSDWVLVERKHRWTNMPMHQFLPDHVMPYDAY